MEKLKVTYRKVEDLIPYVNNARTHSEEQITRIASSIKEFGFTNPILTDGENGIIAGHGRLSAAKKLGMTEVPTVELAGLTKTQKKAYILADNKLALDAGWDDELLKIELEDLKLDNFDLDIIGFPHEEIEGLVSVEGGDDGLYDEYSAVEGKVMYEPKETHHLPEELFQRLDNKELQQLIDQEKSPKLREMFSQRLAWFTDFKYQKIADFYAYQATPEQQKIIERLGLVLLDKDGLIENGFADIQEHIKESGK